MSSSRSSSPRGEPRHHAANRQSPARQSATIANLQSPIGDSEYPAIEADHGSGGEGPFVVAQAAGDVEAEGWAAGGADAETRARVELRGACAVVDQLTALRAVDED